MSRFRRWCNLREANRSQNNINSKIQKNNKTGMKGAYYDKRRDYWYSEIWVIVSFPTAEEAGDAYLAAAERFYEEFAA